jgi:tetratricopeptide (TPR) repeat protein
LPERARERWLEVYALLGKITGAELRYVEVVRHAVAYGLGMLEAWMGLESAARWAELLEQDPMQRVNGLYVRRSLRLQQGDAEGAERFRKEAEICALQARVRQMFSGSSYAELHAYAIAGDLTSVKEIVDRMDALVAQNSNWSSFRLLARAEFQHLRGDLDAARADFEGVIAVSAPDEREPARQISPWAGASKGLIEVLTEQGRYAEAKAYGERALAACRERGIDLCAHIIQRPLALAEAKLGQYAQGCDRLDALIAQQRALGVTGLHLGATYEARARIAIWAGDGAGIERYTQLTAQEYRHGSGSALGARYEGLMGEVRRASVRPAGTRAQK